MEVMVPMAPAKNFHADKSAGNTPYVSAPSSPRGGFDYLYHYTSAPSSPTRITAIYSSIPFQWEDKLDPSNDADHQMGNNNNNDDEEFEFNFSGQLQKGALAPELTAADELFEAGKIRTLKQPRSQSSQSRRGAAGEDVLVRRGRSGPLANSSRARSLSPLRGGGGGIGVGKEEGSSRKDNKSSSSSSSSSSSIVSFLRSAGNGSKKWRLRDLLLFRSASEGRVTGRGSKDPLRKYTTAIAPPLISSKPSSGGEDSKSSSFRSTDSGGSVRRGALSPHEMHYTTNRATSEERRKKTPLAYHQGLFGCLRFNPAVTAISRGFNTQSFFSRG